MVAHHGQGRGRESQTMSPVPSHQTFSPPVPPHPWEWLQRPMAHVHVDYAGPFLRKMFLILADAYSKWIDMAVLCSAASTATIKTLDHVCNIRNPGEPSTG